MKEFDLFKLHKEEDERPGFWICAIGNDLNLKIEQILDEIVKEKSKEIIYVVVKKEFMQNIYKKAILKSVNQQNLANRLSVSRQSICRWKENKGRIPLSILIKLVKYSNMNVNLKEMILETKKIISGINKYQISKMIAKTLNVSLHLPERIIYGKRKEIPIPFILKLLNIWKNLLNKSNKDMKIIKKKIQNTFEFLKQNNGRAKKVKIIRNLNESLSKLVGAMLADGSIASSDNSIRLGDEDKVGVEYISNLIYNLFDIKVILRKHPRLNMWHFKLDNKIIQRYFTEIFNFDKGKKRGGYDIPEIIKNSNFKIRKACVQGIMTFDGVVRMKAEIGLNIGSKNLRDSVFNILIKDGINVTKLDKLDSTGMWRLYSSGIFNKEQYKKWLTYFIINSDKWYKIYEFINGFQGQIKGINESYIILEKCFPKKNASKLSLTEILNLFVHYKNLTLNQISILFKEKNIIFNEETLWEYTKILRKMNIIFKKRLSDNTNIYILIANIIDWRLPYRPYLSEFYRS